MRVLDVCCGGRMFWFDKKNPDAIYVDIRKETVIMPDKTAKIGFQTLTIKPDVLADFIRLPFKNESFNLVVFDPPHIRYRGYNGYNYKRYGALRGNWEIMLSGGFYECFRVLKVNGTLIFKWSDFDFPVSKILTLTPMKPLFGHKSGKASKTHWITFIK